jgi:chemotaxis protein MotB
MVHHLERRFDCWQRVLTLLPFFLALGVTSCTSPDQFRQAIDERDAEIANLREEGARLKSERQGLLAELDTMGAQLREASLRREAKPVASQPVAQPGLEDLGIGYAYRDGVAVITIPSSITFGSGKASLSTEGQSALLEVARVLSRSHAQGTYSIEGHTDTDPISKSKFGTNRALSLARATAVLTYLVEDCSVPDDRCVVVGHGQYRPLDPGTSTGAKAKNRRVEIVVYGGAN